MAIHRTISDFKSALQGGGARPNLFEVHPIFTSSAGHYLEYYKPKWFQLLM